MGKVRGRGNAHQSLARKTFRYGRTSNSKLRRAPVAAVVLVTTIGTTSTASTSLTPSPCSAVASRSLIAYRTPLKRAQSARSDTMVHKILFWAGFGTNTITQQVIYGDHANWLSAGIATRFVQLGIEMRPFFQRGNLWVYTLFAGVGGSFGYWMKGVEDRQVKMLHQRKQIIIEKRRRRAERELAEGGNGGEHTGILASTS